MSRILEIMTVATVVLLVLCGVAFCTQLIVVDVTDSWVVVDEVYETVEDGRRLRHRHLENPWFPFVVEKDAVDIVPEDVSP